MSKKKQPQRKSGKSARAVRTDWKPGKTALITGASGGIGYDLGSVFAENGFNLVLVARNKEKLLGLANQAQQMLGVSAKVIAKDLSEPGAAEEVFRIVEKEGIQVDVLVNNAGFGMLGSFAFNGMQSELGMIRLNVMAVTHMTKLFLPPMMTRGHGRILNVASTAGFRPGPLMTTYSATKAYVLSFSTALAEEVRERGISVSVLCPGPTYTGFQERAGMKETPLQRLVQGDPRVVARAAFDGMIAGKTVIVPGLLNKLATIVSRLAPLSWAARSAKGIYEKAQKPAIRRIQ